ncbi:hypothetical protein GH714_025638 [Hevea brasiliensis]|uniref:Major facilitator superfamily (MFS) profile domain-containing protein n=1 Tax=Hevea brasiliensis TaxID=3981 RepID=A0A6A6LLX6_HEVBR|nr:hypothetical protein GH714_025638 [Hevea brasiliensis]
MLRPVHWFKMLGQELHWSFVVGVMIVYGISQGLGVGLSRVSTQYYMKDEQKVQPSEAQVYFGLLQIPWIIKPLWGLLTDTLPILGYRRRPYFVFAGFLSMITMLVLSLQKNLHLAFALLSLMAGSAGIAIADVTIDACVTQNSISNPSLAGDMQSLCGLSSSIGALVGFSLSGFLVHIVGPKGVFGLLSIPAGLIILVGIMLRESHAHRFAYRGVNEKLLDAGKAMWTTLKCREVWRPCLYMYLSLAVSLNVHEGMFYWIARFDTCLACELENRFTRLLFVVIDEAISRMIGRVKWMPLLVLSSKLCPAGIEGTFFALLMSIDHVGMLSSTWAGGLLLHVLKVTRTQFENLWMAILIRSMLRMVPVSLLFMIPRSDPNLSILPAEMLKKKKVMICLKLEILKWPRLLRTLEIRNGKMASRKLLVPT